MRTLDDEWGRFAACNVPELAGEAQREDMKRTFYAGAACLLAVESEVYNDDSLSEQAKKAVVDGIAGNLMIELAALCGESVEITEIKQ